MATEKADSSETVFLLVTLTDGQHYQYPARKGKEKVMADLLSADGMTVSEKRVRRHIPPHRIHDITWSK